MRARCGSTRVKMTWDFWNSDVTREIARLTKTKFDSNIMRGVNNKNSAVFSLDFLAVGFFAGFYYV